MDLERPEWMTPPEPARYDGAEPFAGANGTVRDFWAYAFRDLKSNTTRGLLAEFLVAQAVGADWMPPDWHEYDVRTPAGIKVEVKSSAYVQAWTQRSLSTIRFSGLRARRWKDSTRADDATFNADVYVFAVQTARSHEAYDPLEVGQWDFYVLPVSTVSEIGQTSIGLGRIGTLVDPVKFDKLAAAIAAAAGP